MMSHTDRHVRRLAALVIPLLGCGEPASKCATAEQLAAVEIAFIRTYDDGRRELRGASLDGLDVPLLCTDEPVAVEGLIGWSADGASLAITESLADESWVSILDLGAPAVQRISRGSAGRWSPVGRRLAFIVRGGGILDKELFVWDDGAITSLATGDARTISWGPDGTELITFAERETDGTLAVGTTRLGLDGSSEQIASGWYSEWSPDGKYLAYAGPPQPGGSTWILYLRELATGEVRPLGSLEDLIPGLHPRWSFDSELVAVGMGYFDCSQPQCYVVGVLAVDGSVQSSAARNTNDFAWSARDTRIVAVEPTIPSDLYGPTRLQIRRGAGDEVVAPAADDDPWSDAQPAWRP